jgi:hypothetical protein
LALPVTFLILLVTTLSLVTVTYYFSVQNLQKQAIVLKASIAQQNFRSLDNLILSTLGQPGSSNTIDITDSGGTTKIQPSSNILTISLNDGSSIDQIIFNSTVGQVACELPTVASMNIGFYLEGDSQTITNQSGASPSQLYLASGAQGPEIQLKFRPTVTYSNGGLQNDQAVNDIRVYIVNFNTSDPITLRGDLPLKISCVNTQLTTQTYQVFYQLQSLAITSQLDGTNGTVSIPISNAPQGAIINVETVVSNISIQRWIR